LIAANGGSLVVEVEFLNATTNLSNDGASWVSILKVKSGSKI
jgi:hypothetical protein